MYFVSSLLRGGESSSVLVYCALAPYVGAICGYGEFCRFLGALCLKHMRVLSKFPGMCMWTCQFDRSHSMVSLMYFLASWSIVIS